MKIETKRLILRPVKKSDWKDIVEGIGNLEVSKYLSTVPYPYKKKDADWWINKQINNWRKKKKENYEFVIELKSEKKVIGASGFHKVDEFVGKAISGSWIARKYWRKGYITEAKIALNDFAFNKLKLQKLETEAFSENKGSNAMSKKLGYKEEGVKRKTNKAKSTGKLHNANQYGILKNEWKKARIKLIKDLNKKLK